MGSCCPKQEKRPYEKGAIPPKLRNQVWDNGDGRCYVCGNSVGKGWHCSHIVAEVKGGPTTVDNLRVCCAHCNLSMGDLNMYRYIEVQIAKGEKLTGEGVRHYQSYLKKHPQYRKDTRTNNWGKPKSH